VLLGAGFDVLLDAMLEELIFEGAGGVYPAVGIANIVAKSSGAGAEKVSSVGLPQSGEPGCSVPPQQAQSPVEALYIASRGFKLPVCSEKSVPS
jgi:hypothetical protein